VVPAKTLVVAEEVGLSAEDVLGNDWPAAGSTEAVVVIARLSNSVGLVIPSVRVQEIVEIIFVAGSVPGVGAALGDDLNFGSGGAIEVGRLISGIDLEFLDAVERSRHDAGGAAADLALHDATGRIAREGRRVNGHAAIHIVGVLTAIEHESALINDRSRNAAVGRNAGLEGHESGRVAVNGGEGLQLVAGHGVADGSVHGLQVGAGCVDFYSLGDGTKLHRDVERKSRANGDRLAGYFGGPEACLGNGQVVGSRGNVSEEVATTIVGWCGTSGIGRGIGQGDDGIDNCSTRWIGYSSSYGAGIGSLSEDRDRYEKTK